MRFLDNRQRKNIGFDYIIEHIDTISKLGDDKKRAISPYTKKSERELSEELSNTEKMIGSLSGQKDLIEEIGYTLHKVKDILPTLKKIGTGMVLDEIELFEIKVFSKVCTDLRSFYSRLERPLYFAGFIDVNEVFSMLDPEDLGYETFYIYDGFSEGLKELREQRRAIEQQIQSEKDMDTKNALLMRRADILNDEEKIGYDIRRSLTQQLEKYAADMIHNADRIGYLDLLIAKAKFFIASKATRPTILFDNGPIFLENVYNPYYEQVLESKGAQMQRLSLTLRSGVTVLTGANMGGKSIAMKTVALNVLLANCGMYVYADRADVPVIDFLYMVSDDLQSIDTGLSTFGAEMIELKGIIGASSKKNGLIVLDELARGTNPEEGRTIVNAMIRLFNERESHTFISTHFDGVDLNEVTHLQVVGISRVDFEQLRNMAKKNSKEALSILQRHMDYSVEEIGGSDVPRNALQIANLLGLEMLDLERVE